MPAPSPARRAGSAVAAVVAAITLAACGSDDDPAIAPPPADGSPSTTTAAEPASTTTTVAPGVRTETFEVVGGAVTGGARSLESGTGEQLRIVVSSDVADEVHLHGYDIHAEVAPGADATIELATDIPGQFEIELEDRKLRLGELEVR